MNITIGNPWAVSEKGGRLNNEDSIFPLPETANSNQNLFLVCDGVGGLKKGRLQVHWLASLSRLFSQLFVKVRRTQIL